VAAWAVNQASRSQPKDRRALIDASGALREAQERLIAGEGSAAELEKAAAAQRAGIDALVDAAAGLLSGEGKGLGETVLARVRETFAAVASDEELAALVEAGTLDRERRPSGLGFGFISPGPAREVAKPRGKAAKPRDKGPKRAAKAAKQREREVRSARERVKAARAGEKDAARARKAAEREAKKAAGELERAERALADARERAQAARDELDAASAAADAATSTREAAEAALERLG
jgi:hypothetical protein